MSREPADVRPGKPTGKVRAARLTDLPALGELSRIAQTEGSGSRTLGLPVNGPPIGVFSLFRLPLVAFRPHDLLFVYEADRHVAGLVRVERESWRDDWTIVELDAIGRRAATRGAARRDPARSASGSSSRSCARARSAAPPGSTSPARTPTTTSSCSCRPASCATARSGCCTARRTSHCRAPWTEAAATKARIRAAKPVDANALMQLYTVRDPGAGPAPRGIPDPGLGAPGLELARAAELARADPPVRGPRRLRPGRRRRRQARGVHPDRRRARGPAALPAAPRAAGGRPRGPDRASGSARSRARPGRTARAGRITASSLPCEPTSRRPIDASRRQDSPRSPPSHCS